jgi:hypothetical protein
VTLGESFSGCGNRPIFTPFHQVLRLTGMGPYGARIADNLMKPISGGNVER